MFATWCRLFSGPGGAPRIGLSWCISTREGVRLMYSSVDRFTFLCRNQNESRSPDDLIPKMGYSVQEDCNIRHTDSWSYFQVLSEVRSTFLLTSSLTLLRLVERRSQRSKLFHPCYGETDERKKCHLTLLFYVVTCSYTRGCWWINCYWCGENTSYGGNRRTRGGKRKLGSRERRVEGEMETEVETLGLLVWVKVVASNPWMPPTH